MEVGILENSTQHIRDFKLAIEYKQLISHAPNGVFLMPEMDDIRKLHGVIFVRRGLYQNGIFRFLITLPTQYNCINSHPHIVFTPPIFNPLIDPKTGVMDMKLDCAFEEWKPEKHFLATVLAYVKKSFYMKTFDRYPSVANEDAREKFNNDQIGFLEEVSRAVTESMRRVYDKPSPACTLVFTEPRPAHDVTREQILGKMLAAEAVRDKKDRDKETGSEVERERERGGDKLGDSDPVAHASQDDSFDAALLEDNLL